MHRGGVRPALAGPVDLSDWQVASSCWRLAAVDLLRPHLEGACVAAKDAIEEAADQGLQHQRLEGIADEELDVAATRSGAEAPAVLQALERAPPAGRTGRPHGQASGVEFDDAGEGFPD